MSRVFRDDFRSELVSDATSGVAVEYVRVDVHLKLGDCRSNRPQAIRASHLLMDDERTRTNGERRRRRTQVITKRVHRMRSLPKAVIGVVSTSIRPNICVDAVLSAALRTTIIEPNSSRLR